MELLDERFVAGDFNPESSSSQAVPGSDKEAETEKRNSPLLDQTNLDEGDEGGLPQPNRPGQGSHTKENKSPKAAARKRKGTRLHAVYNASLYGVVCSQYIDCANHLTKTVELFKGALGQLV